MQNEFDPRTSTSGYNPAVSVGVPRAARDAGLRSYMLSVYNYMASGVLLTGIVALAFAPQALALHRLEANVAVANRASQRVLEAAGFSQEGIARGLLLIRGEWIDHYRYALLNTDAIDGRTRPGRS